MFSSMYLYFWGILRNSFKHPFWPWHLFLPTSHISYVISFRCSLVKKPVASKIDADNELDAAFGMKQVQNGIPPSDTPNRDTKFVRKPTLIIPCLWPWHAFSRFSRRFFISVAASYDKCSAALYDMFGKFPSSAAVICKLVYYGFYISLLI